MKAPLSWLKEYVDIDCSAEELKEKLFSCGFEVEGTEYIGYNLKNIVTCKIIEIAKHPNADRLSVTKIDAGEFGIKQIITSATNIFEGAVVPVALNGAVVASGEKIKTGKIRGVESEGMFCSGEELGINDDWYKGASVNGILILDQNFKLGEDITKTLDLLDVMFDINVTANRPDCQSILGIAREVAAVLKKPFKMPSLDYEVSENVSTVDTIKVSVTATDLCPRYISHLVKNVKIAESPLWMKRRLFKMGIRSINNIVDITNYVLTELGGPMHAFDLNDIGKNEIIVRRASDGEKITTLDEKEFTLNSDNLVICDGEKPIALAGIMGGLNSEIKPDTKNIVFESANFKRDNIRKSSRNLGQSSDSSSRYEKGIDVYTTDLAMKRALSLISELKCGEIAKDGYDVLSVPITEKVIETTLSKVNGVLGIDIPKNVVEEILTGLNFKVKIDGDKLTCVVPQYREDMESYPDIAEELIREYGYSHINPTLLKTSSITNGGRNTEQTNIEELKNLLVGFGFNEIITYSFVSEKDFESFGYEKEERIKIINPIGEDMAVMRTSLFPSIVKTVFNNLNRKNFDGRLFEFAKTYKADKLPLDSLPVEKSVLSLAVFGEKETFFTLKGIIEKIIYAFTNKKADYIPCDFKRLHPYRSAKIMINGDCVGYFGQVNPEITAKFDIDKPIFAGEIYYDELIKFFDQKIVFKAVSKFPTVERDIAICVDEAIPAAEISKVIEESSGKYLESVKLFDVYVGKQVGEGKKSMAYNLKFVAEDRTLEVSEIEDVIKKILKRLKEKFGAELR